MEKAQHTRHQHWFSDLLSLLLLVLFAIMLGALCKYLDLHTEWLGNLFSELSIWFFLCIYIAVTSRSPLLAGIRVFSFLLFMLIGYYLCAQYLSAPYGWQFIQFWVIITLFSPLCAIVTWYAKGRCHNSKKLCLLILLLMFLFQFILYSHFKIVDMILLLMSAAVLFSEDKAS